MRRDPRPISARRRVSPRGRVARRPIDRRAGGFHRDQHRRDVRCFSAKRGGTGRRFRTIAPAHFRFVHVSTDEVFGSLGAHGPFQRALAVCAELSILGQQGRRRPSRARLASHLRLARHRHELLEQLRTVPVSREADSSHDSERARVAADRGVRARRERSRLALCGRSRRAPCWRLWNAAESARRTRSARAPSAGTSMWLKRCVRLLDELEPRPRRRALSGSHRVRSRPPGSRLSLRDRSLHDRARACVASDASSFETGLRKTVAWYLENDAWSNAFAAARTAASALASARRV